MYSYEERMRAVALYIKLGKRPHATISELGYPTKNSLKGWYLEYERQKDLPAAQHDGRQSSRKLKSRQRWHIMPATADRVPRDGVASVATSYVVRFGLHAQRTQDAADDQTDDGSSRAC